MERERVGRVNETKKNEINGMRRQLTGAKERWKRRREKRKRKKMAEKFYYWS